MDATLTNLGTSPIFLPGPNIELAATGDADGNDVKSVSGITVADLDADDVVKAYVVAGTLQVDLTPSAADAALATTGALQHSGLERYAVASLPTGFNGRVAYATDGRAGAEGAGLGTGTPVVFTNGQWRRFEDLAQVAA